MAEQEVEVPYAEGTVLAPKSELKRDALNRALRTLWTTVGVDALVAVVLLVQPVVEGAGSWSEVDWRILGFSVVKTVVLVVFSYLLRRFLDGSRVPTPRPPLPLAGE